MLVKVPYIDKNDNAFYDIIKNELGMDSFFCYEIKNDLVYVNIKNNFSIKMPKLIKKLCNSTPDENFLIIELQNETLYVYVNNGEKDFEYYEYSNSETPLKQFFMSIFQIDAKYNIYYIENEELKKILDNVFNTLSNFHKFNEEDITPVDVNITNQDIEEFFTKISLDEKIKQQLKNIKNKFKNLKKNKTNKIKKRYKFNSNIEPKTLVLGGIALALILYYLYSNDYFKSAYEYFFPAPVVVKEEMIEIPKPKVDMTKVNMLHNYTLYNYVKNKIENNNIDLLEYSNGEVLIVGDDNNIEKPKYKYFIDSKLYIMEETLKQEAYNEEKIKEFSDLESLDIKEFIEYKSENQIILRIKKDNLDKIIRQLLCNDKLKYNLNIYRINDIYQVILYSDNVIEDVSGKVELKQEVIMDTGSFQTK